MALNQQLNWFNRNLRPDYRLRIRRNDLTNVSSFIRAVRGYELLYSDLEKALSHRLYIVELLLERATHHHATGPAQRTVAT
ncbi:hypothetical protein JTB14_018827 [Gonioctena quinquepunctata]|nr:hypothetical protein JTB14_018827 [Gonioctena quinquepunctata]